MAASDIDRESLVFFQQDFIMSDNVSETISSRVSTSLSAMVLLNSPCQASKMQFTTGAYETHGLWSLYRKEKSLQT